MASPGITKDPLKREPHASTSNAKSEEAVISNRKTPIHKKKDLRVVSKSNANSKEAIISIKKTPLRYKKQDLENIPDTANHSTFKQPRSSMLKTPKQQNKTPSSITKSGLKSWQRRPKPAHSGVPVPEKMRVLMEKALITNR